MSNYLPADLLEYLHSRLPFVPALTACGDLSSDVAAGAFRETEAMFFEYFWQPRPVALPAGARVLRLLARLRHGGSVLVHRAVSRVREAVGEPVLVPSTEYEGDGPSGGGPSGGVGEGPSAPEMRGVDRGAILRREIDEALKTVERSQAAQEEINRQLEAIQAALQKASQPGAPFVFNPRIIVNIVNAQQEKEKSRLRRFGTKVRDAIFLLAAVAGIYTGAVLAWDRNTDSGPRPGSGVGQTTVAAPPSRPVASDVESSGPPVITAPPRPENSPDPEGRPELAEEPVEELAEGLKVQVVEPTGLVVRAGPQKQSARLGAIACGKVVQIVQWGSEYSRVLYVDVNGELQEGFVISRGLSVREP
ncbi:SH3 domain-containing protein [Ruegeria marina]|uniref:SH3 domain-containing protein n=1 Tax=Ruegeria marina TaxID=639004 RepID=A0A1G6QB05_9RHOB|nr:SH3 domain-containing protein [Ruegeria marina]SDC89670.1 hypothetical protein SAMN04488239_10476 [Ruegeria marina]